MTTDERMTLEKRRNELMRERERWESAQTDFSYSKLIFGLCQKRMDMLDYEAEEIRQVLEMAVQYDGK